MITLLLLLLFWNTTDLCYEVTSSRIDEEYDREMKRINDEYEREIARIDREYEEYIHELEREEDIEREEMYHKELMKAVGKPRKSRTYRRSIEKNGMILSEEVEVIE